MRVNPDSKEDVCAVHKTLGFVIIFSKVINKQP